VKALFKRYAERIDAATLRERVMIFLAATVVLVFVVNAALIEPLRAKQKRITAETTQLAQDLDAVQGQLGTLVQKVARDPDAANRARLAALREQLAQLNSRVVQEQRRFTPADRMRDVLEEMLRRNRELALVDLKTLPVTPIGASPAGAAIQGGAYRHGIEFTVSGSYAQLYEYLRTLERLPTQLYWGQAELVATDHSVLTLKLTAYTVSFDPAWLIV
jgi:MSHA biogenesis protein MshJ